MALMSLFRFKRRVAYVNAYGLCYGGSRYSGGDIEIGEVREGPPVFGYGVYPEDVEPLPDPRDDGPPGTVAEVASGCNDLLNWIGAGHLAGRSRLCRRVVAQRLRQLADAYAMLPDAPPLSFDVRAAGATPDLASLVNRVKTLRQESGSLEGGCAEAAEQGEGNSDDGAGRRPRGRPRGSDSAAGDLKLFLDWKSANQATGITKVEFLRERGLPAGDWAAIERGRAHEKRRRSGQK
jgi:hypothetical protein